MNSSTYKDHFATAMKKVAVVLSTLFAVATNAQEIEPISTERPGFSSSPFTLAPGVVQIESVYQYLHDGGQSGLDDHTLPLLLVRLGMTESVELQLNWAGYSWSELGNSSYSGVNDASVGVKWNVSSAGARVPVALFAGISLPAGSDEYSTDEFDPTLGAFWSYSGKLNWFGTVLIRESDDDSSFSNAVGINLPVNETMGGYIEYFGTYGQSGGPENYLNGGITYVPRPDLQYDLHAGAGLNGLAYRF
jgi:hypothetical protein